MKRIYLLIILAICSLTAASQLRYGLKLGGDFTRPTAKEIVAHGGSGFTGGLQIEYQLPTSGFAFEADILYERRNINTMEDNEDATHKFGGNFLALPITIKYKIPIKSLFELISPFISTGPDFALRINAASGSRFHTGWNLGLGLDVINFIQINAGYRFGINDICPGLGTIRNNGWFFDVGILFDF